MPLSVGECKVNEWRTNKLNAPLLLSASSHYLSPRGKEFISECFATINQETLSEA